MDVQQKLDQCLNSVKKRVGFQPKLGLILGSGLGDFGDHIDVKEVLPYGEIEGFPVSTVSGHKGRFLFGTVEGVPMVAMQGRVHYYEGYPMSDVVLPTRLMALLGVEVLMLTNAAGSVNLDFAAGDFMLITDHITSFVPSPIIGPVFGGHPRFPDMSAVYDKALCGLIRGAAKEKNLNLREGVYLQFTGPQFETPTEVRMARVLGADAVGMSTACEAVAAHHMGVRICGISCISNLGCGISDQPLSGADVDEMAGKVGPIFRDLVTGSIAAIGKTL